MNENIDKMVPESEKFSLEYFLDEMKNKNVEIKYIIDINYSNNYYNYQKWLETNIQYGNIKHYKIALIPKRPPSEEVLARKKL